ncbi:STAS/SEC14 domain-containing protein [Vreelandella jeotgali]|uniref:STAS/SEC14 domain-containing protein n=1 Tax=Vreelandella jeotgali TaxID=553386 RepID=UPI0003470778|nr:STAS/SEC14 domain-containing protein [Halomonas jeotgali]
MIKQLPQSEGATIGVEVSGRISSEEEQEWIERFNALIEQHPSISVLVVLDGRIAMDIDAVFQDLKWTFQHLKNLDRLAIVSDSQVLGWLVAADSPFGKLVGISEKHFDTRELDNAWQWVKA